MPTPPSRSLSPSAPDSRPSLILCALLPALVGIAYILVTRSIWEDFLITFRHSENLVLGHGLVYQPGERVHGFTSVINTLLPAIPRWLGASLEGSLAFYQLCSLGALSLGLYVLLRALHAKLGFSLRDLAGISLLVAFSTKIIAFSSNGQEGGFLVCFLCLALAAVLRLAERNAWVILGLASAGLLYTRPDSPVYLFVLAVIAFSYAPKPAWETLRALVRAGLLATVLFLPWVLVAWWYYGSPVPHTVIAKSGGALLVEGSVVKTLLAMAPQFVMGLLNIFGPIYPPGNWPEPVLLACLIAGSLVMFYWAVPVRDPVGRACSGGVALLLSYLAFVGAQRLAFPWYFVPASLLGSIALVSMVRQLLLLRWRWAGTWAATIFGFVTLTSAYTLTVTFRQMRLQQEEIENGTRRALGTFLKNNAKAGDSVYAECLGYIGYYYGGKMLDYPGLVSPEVVRARREHGDKLELVPEVLKPDWIIARPQEIDAILKREKLRDAYEVIGQADARERLDARGRFAGDALLRFDDFFYILHRREAAPGRP